MTILDRWESPLYGQVWIGDKLVSEQVLTPEEEEALDRELEEYIMLIEKEEEEE